MIDAILERHEIQQIFEKLKLTNQFNEKFKSSINRDLIQKNNQIANHLIKNIHIHECFKHINMIYYHVCDLIKRNFIQLNYVSNTNMMINELTKPLTQNRFKNFVSQLGFDAWNQWKLIDNDFKQHDRDDKHRMKMLKVMMICW